MSVVTIGLLRRRGTPYDLKPDPVDFADDVRFVPVVYDDLEDLTGRWANLAEGLDAAVFPGAWLHGMMRAKVQLGLPCTHLRLTSDMLYAALLRAASSGIAVRNISVDSMDAMAAAEAHSELELADSTITVMEYHDRHAREDYVRFHLDNMANGATVAVTAFDEPERALVRSGHPVVRFRTTPSTVRAALRQAVTLARGSQLEEQQIAVIAVELPAPGNGTPLGPSNYSQQQLRLSINRILLEEAHVGGGVLTSRSDSLFVVVLTRGGLDRITGDLTVAPFTQRCHEDLAIDLAVGVGLGASAQTAERHALAGLENASSAGTQHGCVLVETNGERRNLDTSARPDQSPATTTTTAKDLATLRELVASLNSDVQNSPEPWVVDLNRVSAALGVSQRTAGRVCRTLTEAGLAWPIPALRSERGGRPRHQYQLLVAKLE